MRTTAATRSNNTARGRVRVHILGSRHAEATVTCDISYPRGSDGRLCGIRLDGSGEWIVCPVEAVDFDRCVDCGLDDGGGPARCEKCALEATGGAL